MPRQVMSSERATELRRYIFVAAQTSPCGCSYLGSEIYERCDEHFEHYAKYPNGPSPFAFSKADKLINALQEERDGEGRPKAPCLRDDLEDHREWVRLRIAEFFERYVFAVEEQT